MLCGDSDDEVESADSTLSNQNHRHVMAIAQDLLHTCVLSGRVMTTIEKSNPVGGEGNSREAHWVS